MIFSKYELVLNNKKYLISQIQTYSEYESQFYNLCPRMTIEITPHTFEECYELFNDLENKRTGNILTILYNDCIYELNNYMITKADSYQGIITTIKLDLVYESFNCKKRQTLGFFNN